ncbi:sigma-70 family RNA polymerase sigma factor [Modestobacter sp. SSW1-42]|uniref:sigma-70 family RNA polymerase sigma factor n=1 Tax=Modestobacter sp. SSW1-42 TaxID=596372 RepID=UPI0039869A0B
MTSLAGPDQGRTADGSLADLLDRWTGPALGLARRIVADDRIAEDVVQEAFVAYWRNPAAFASARGSFGSWFLALVHHKAVDAVRHEASLRRRTDADAEDRARTDELGSPDIAEVVADRMGDARVRRALDALPAAQREALVLAYWGGYTQREIAARTGAPLGTVKTRMLAGMDRLQQVLDGGVLTTAG